MSTNSDRLIKVQSPYWKDNWMIKVQIKNSRLPGSLVSQWELRHVVCQPNLHVDVDTLIVMGLVLGPMWVISVIHARNQIWLVLSYLKNCSYRFCMRKKKKINLYCRRMSPVGALTIYTAALMDLRFQRKLSTFKYCTQVKTLLAVYTAC